MTAKKFALELNKEVLDSEEKIGNAIELMAMFALRGVVQKSPVDTGRFRGNWIVSRHSPSKHTRKTSDKNGNQTIKKGAKVIERFKYKESIKLFEQSIIIQNNLPYANRLENGWSKTQAPHGMIAVTIAEMNVRYRNILL